MTSITISAQVVNGHLQHDKPLLELEGQRVLATVTLAPKECTNGQDAEKKAQEINTGEFDPEPPPWLEVEKDLYFPIKIPEVHLGKRKVRVERGKPSIILPEDLPDE